MFIYPRLLECSPPKLANIPGLRERGVPNFFSSHSILLCLSLGFSSLLHISLSLLYIKGDAVFIVETKSLFFFVFHLKMIGVAFLIQKKHFWKSSGL